MGAAPTKTASPSLPLPAPPVLFAYLLGVVAAESLATAGSLSAGLWLHLVLLFSLLFHAAATSQATPGISRFLLGLALVPLLRVFSLSVPLSPFSTLQWLGIVSVPLLAACGAVLYTLRLRRRDEFLTFGTPKEVPWQVLVAAAGIPLGFVEFAILAPPEPWIADYTVGSVLFAVAVFALATGVAEELIFRGILLKLGGDLVGPGLALLYVTAVFTALHLGFRSPLDILFILAVALVFGLVALKTKILWGVIASHTSSATSTGASSR